MAANRYFLYSKEEEAFRREIETKIGNEYKPGYVIVNGRRRPFTRMGISMTSDRYPDTVVVTEGDPEKLKYTLPSVIRRK